ncbi:MAG: dienelactone hydrolase family protein [Pseudonocardiaceae bacterium]
MRSTFDGDIFEDSRGFSLPYRRFIPPEYSEPSRSLERFPLILSLHGVGECGDDNEAQLGNGVAELLGSLTSPHAPCFSVVPQCPTGRQWVDVSYRDQRHVIPAELALPLFATLELLDWHYAQYRIDLGRIYLIGLSMGGYGVWDLLCRLPERFAAAVPICGGADDNVVAKARSVPIWAFHGALDPVVPVKRSRRAIEAVRAAGGTPRYTEYPDVGHDSWTGAFAEPDLLPWLCSQRAGVPDPWVT